MDIAKVINEVRIKISEIEEFCEQKYIENKPITKNELENVENELGFIFPNSLRQFYLNKSAGLQYSWTVVQDLFRLEYDNGWLHILSPNEILLFHKEIKVIIEETVQNKEISDFDEEIIESVKDWEYWIPIVLFPNGDAFCIDKKSDYKNVLFLEHDVMDSGPNLHGLKLAKNFDDLLDKWSKVAFIDIFDWTEGVDSDGINLKKQIYKPLLELINTVEH